MFDTLFELLFKHRWLVFEQGTFALGAPVPAYVAILLAAAAGAWTILTYGRARGRSTARDRAILTGLRLAALAVVLFCLLRPVLVLSTVVPQQNFLGIVVDDSRSMQVTDLDTQARSRFVVEQLGTPDSSLRSALADRFALRFFKFSSGLDRLTEIGDLTFDGTRTQLGQALERSAAELTGVPLSGLVLVTDGADNSQAAITEPLLALRASAVPVFTVGLGREELERDIQLSRVETPRTALEGAALVVDVVVAQQGYAGETVSVQVEDDGRIVGSEEVVLPPDGEPATVRMRFTASDVGPRLFRFRVPPRPGEMVTQNNVQEALIIVEDHRERVLYFEGEPRFEVGFLRRAVAEDENLQVVVLQRTAENKFLRLAVDDPEELAGGFPKTREELFQYRGLIIGSVEASHFTPDQLRMIADFVSQRGGGLLMLGSRHSFAEGGYAGTPVADVMPVTLEAPPNDAGEPTFLELRVVPTRAGLSHIATQIAPTEEESGERWKTLPLVSTLNAITDVKPGATVLLTGTPEGTPDGASEERVVLAYQRYGRGKALAFPIQDSWMWQMHADVPLEDLTHETFWRRLLRWLVDDVPDQVEVSLSRERVEPDEPVTVVAAVDDTAFVEVNNSDVVAEITGPSGSPVEVPLEWTLEHDGEYQVSYVPEDAGLYEVRVHAAHEGESLGTDVAYFQVGPSGSEYFDAGMRAPLLRRIAEEAGGRFYTPDTVGTLPEDINYVGGGVTVIEERELWDMPVLLVLVVGLVGTEWVYRRARELP